MVLHIIFPFHRQHIMVVQMHFIAYLLMIQSMIQDYLWKVAHQVFTLIHAQMCVLHHYFASIRLSGSIKSYSRNNAQLTLPGSNMWKQIHVFGIAVCVKNHREQVNLYLVLTLKIRMNCQSTAFRCLISRTARCVFCSTYSVYRLKSRCNI